MTELNAQRCSEESSRRMQRGKSPSYILISSVHARNVVLPALPPLSELLLGLLHKELLAPIPRLCEDDASSEAALVETLHADVGLRRLTERHREHSFWVTLHTPAQTDIDGVHRWWT